MPGSQGGAQQTAQAGGQPPGGQQQPGQPGSQSRETEAGAAGDASETGGEFDTAQASQQQQSDDIDFSEEESSAGSPASTDGSPSAGNTTASGGATGRQGQNGSGGGSARSYDERVAVLDKQLDGSMGEYDGMILQERRNVLSQAGEEGSEEQVEDFDRDVAYYEEGDLQQAGGPAGTQTAGAPAPPGGQSGQNGSAQSTGGQSTGHPNGSDAGGPGRANDVAYPPPDDIPSGDDDDVVARQIREAAMHEDDPELREKLWEEYRKYKEQTS